MELSKLQREIISRSTAGIAAGALLFGAYKCFAARVPIVAIILLVLGIFIALFAIAPGIFVRLLGPPRPPETGVNPDSPAALSWWDLFLWW